MTAPRVQGVRGWLGDALILLVGVLLVPIVILLAGTPIMLLGALVRALAR